MKKFFLILSVSSLCSFAYGFEIQEFFDRAAQTVKRLVGIESEVDEERVQLPMIPIVERSATSTAVYENKNLPIYQQGKSYLELSEQEKLKYRVAFVGELYQVTRNAAAKESDLATYVNVLEQGGSREGVYRAITLDQVYAALENYEETPSQKLQEFVIDFGREYLNREFSASAVTQLNLWTIKRIVVDRTLEVMDALAVDANDLNSWYAVLSGDLAGQYPGLWQNKVRSHLSDIFHLDWAQKAPYEHIKSETIIKLHMVMNALNN